MKLQTKFFLLIILVFSIIIGLVFVQRYFDLQRAKNILSTTLDERKKTFAISQESEGELFNTFIKDYSFWDDMVDFVKTGDKEFAANNLETGLDLYKASAIWIYNPSGKLVYHKSADSENPLKSISLPADFFKKVSADKFTHFYIETEQGLVEVRGGTIVPGNDPDHNNPASGYMVIARLLGDEYLAKLSSLSQTNVKFDTPDASAADQIKGVDVSFTSSLNNINGEVVQLLKSESEVSVVKGLLSSYNRQLLIITIAGISILIIILVGIWLFVLRPIKIISTSISKKDVSMLNDIAKSHSELGELAKVVQEFYKQKVVIHEAEIKQAELEELNKEKTAFLSIAAHELKAPGTIISLLSESVVMHAEKNKVPKNVLEDLDIITHQAKKMTTLVSDLRSSAEGKKMMTREETVFDFDKFLSREVKELAYVIDQKIKLTGHTNKKLQTDEQHLSQVVSNLIRNAAKYSKTDTMIQINSSVKDGNIVVEFIDQGLGISEKDQKHLFERYFRASSVQGKTEGLGLGLSICHDIIAEMGGKIWVKSELGKGSHFYISLPIKKLAPKSKKFSDKIASIKL